LAQLTSRLNLSKERKFGALLFFIDWDDNTFEQGKEHFEKDVKPFLDLAYAERMIPIITWEPVKKDAQGAFAKEYSLPSITQGKSDEYLRGWQAGLQEWMTAHPKYEVRIRLMHEMNAPIARYHWSNVTPTEYKDAYEHVYRIIDTVDGNLQWMFVFQNFTADKAWLQKRASDYDQYIPDVPLDYLGIDGYSRPFLAGVDGPPGGEVTPQQVLPEQFFKSMRQAYPKAKLVISETSVPYMEKTDEPVPYPEGVLSYQMTDEQRASWIVALQEYLIALDQTYALEEVTWFNGNTDYHWSLFASEDSRTVEAFREFMDGLDKNGITVGIYPGE
jgi:hypothetical protein